MNHIHCLKQRDHDRLKRNQHRCDDEKMCQLRVLRSSAVEHVGRRRAEHHDARDTGHGNQHVVPEQTEIIDLIDYIRIIFQLRVGRKRDRILYNFSEWFKGIHIHQVDRININQRHQQKYDQKNDVFYPLFGFISRHNSTSLLLNSFNTNCVTTSTTRK